VPFEDKALRDLTEQEIRDLVQSGMEEHSTLEYKAEPWGNTDAGKKEFLLDCCMFANTKGGLIFVGIAEQRTPTGQPTGVPDPNAVLGVQLENPDATLRAYDASLAATTEERISLESAAVRVEGERYVLAFRVNDSVRKPHGVRYQGHIYFPARRERSRYELSVLEVKDMTQRTGAGLATAEEALGALLRSPRRDTNAPLFFAAVVPVFTRPFEVSLRDTRLAHQLGSSTFRDGADFLQPAYSFDGLERKDDFQSTTLKVSHYGRISVAKDLPYRREADADTVFAIAIDLQLHKFVRLSEDLLRVAEIAGPYVLGLTLSVDWFLFGQYPDSTVPHVAVRAGSLGRGEHTFPFLELPTLEGFERRLRPLCDHIHQSFGKAGSPCFDGDGNWIGNPYAQGR